MKKSWVQLRKDITGESLFYAPSYLFVLPVFWLTSLLATAHWGSWPNLLLWSLANILSMTLCWLVIVLADWLVLRNRTESWIVPILIFSSGVGALKGASTTLFGAWLGVESDIESLIWGRIAQTAVLGLVTIPALAVLASTRLRFQAERDALVAEKVRASAADLASDPKRIQDYRNLAFEISQVRSRLLSDEGATVSKLVRDIVQNALRPLTHRLWHLENDRQTNFTLRDLSRVAIVGHPFVASPVALILFIGTLGPYVNAAGFGEGLARAALTAAFIMVFYRLFGLVKINSLFVAWSYYFLVHGALAASIVVASKFLFGDLRGFTAASAFLLLFVWILQTGYMTSFVAGTLATRNQLQEQLRQLSKELGIEQEVLKVSAQLVQRDHANFLHSDLQNKLLSIALRIETGGESAQLADRELRDIELLLHSGNFVTLNSQVSLADELEAIAERWRGFLVLDVACKLAEAGPTETRIICQILNEALSNAVRHGLATRVEVSIATVGSRTQIEICDDGIGPREGRAGLGSKFFSSVAAEGWSLEALSRGGSKLTVAI